MTISQTPRHRIVDAAPFIGLAKVGRLDILTAGGHTALITQTVVQEIQAGRYDDRACQALREGWGVPRSDVDIPPDLALWNLDAGEEATLALALYTESVAILDDGNGRKAARVLGIFHTGTTGLVVEAKRLGVVASAAAVLRELHSVGLFLPSAPVIHAVLQTVGEEWP